MYYFCTYFDHRYLVRGLALYQSLARHCPSFRLWALCFDPLSYQAASQMGFPNLVPIALAEFEQDNQDLHKTKQTRSLLEYYFTCSPSLPLYVLKNHPEIGMITYLDSDLFFFADPTPIFQEIGDCSIAMTEHRHPPDKQMSWTKEAGIYNVGWLSFRNDGTGLACLRWWQARCLEWCHNRSEDGRYGDQKYLEEWPARFSRVVVVRHQGVNVAPWNLAASRVATRANRVTVNGDPLIVFHFHGLYEVQRFIYDPSWATYRLKLTTTLRQRVYAPYIESLATVCQQVSRFIDAPPLLGSLKETPNGRPAAGRRSALRLALRRTREMIDVLREVHRNRYLFVIRGRAL